MKRPGVWLLSFLAVLFLVVFSTSGCRSKAVDDHQQEQSETAILALPKLKAVDLGGTPLKVVATTSIIGDVVAQVGRDAIELITLMGPGQDPHGYKPTAQDMAAVSRAHVIFVNGWNLEETLVLDLENIGQEIPFVPVSANIKPLAFGGHENEPGEDADHRHEDADPHTWFSIHNVKQWVENIEYVLGDLDPANAATYENNAKAYLAKLEELELYVETQLASIPSERRFLVTNHNSFGYLAHEYNLSVLGTVIPAASTMAEPSASDLSGLITKMEEHGICTLFTETTVNDKLAQTVAAELDGCDEVRVLKLFTGAVGPAGSGADSYIGMFRYNVDTIVEGLQ
ncbi:MAG: zinc ABC transporter substrate-binding protein [Anaerolineae bacterium]|nr:zinc ABC transporter substrate-binding protein [Anaerolineae bacterium]